MSASAHTPRPSSLNRRRRVRQKVHAPAYASFGAASRDEMLDLYEVLDISEIGVAVQCPSPRPIDQEVELCLDLAESPDQITATARVIWSDSAGRVGLGFPPLRDPALMRMREWLFLNAMAAAANASPSPVPPATDRFVPLTYTDKLSAASAVQTEAESLGADLDAVLSLSASRCQSLLRASGVAIALAGKDAGTMICRASVGSSAPPVGVTLQVGSGFSGGCLLTGKLLRCDDTETDERVDLQTCRALGIRSRIAAPVRSGERVIGLFEVFSAQPRAFNENDGAVLQRFAEMILSAVNRAARANGPAAPPPSPTPLRPPASGLLFGTAAEEKVSSEQTRQKPEEQPEAEPEKGPKEDNKLEAAASDNIDADIIGGIRLPRTHLYLLVTAAATIALALGFLLAPWIQEKLHARDRNDDHTVLASSQAPVPTPKSDVSVETADPDQLREMASRGDAAAENAIGLLYAQGDAKHAIGQDENQAAHWFTRAAEDGSVPAQYKLGLLYWGGHGVPRDLNKAYFWAVLSRAGGQEGGKDLAKVLSNGMTRAQAAAIEQQAEIWYQQHELRGKPQPGR
jgi:putative methionine-R-sulfoxide reductase with GAF domain